MTMFMDTTPRPKFHTLTAHDRKVAEEFLENDCAIALPDFTTGSGRWKRLRKVPAWVTVVYKGDDHKHPGATKLFESRPRLGKAFVVDRRVANNIAKGKIKKTKVRFH